METKREDAVKDHRIPMHVISDSLGELGSTLANGIWKQFPGSFGHIKRFPFISKNSEIEEILQRSKRKPWYSTPWFYLKHETTL